MRRRPTVLDELCDDLAVEISLEMKRRKLTIGKLREAIKMSPRHSVSLSRYLRGVDTAQFGYIAALRVAEHLNIPVAVRVGAEARELMQ